MSIEKRAVSTRQDKTRLFEKLDECRVSLSVFFSDTEELKLYSEYKTLRDGEEVSEVTHRVYSYLYSKRYLIEEIALPLVTKKQPNKFRDFRFRFKNKRKRGKTDKRRRNIFVFDRDTRQFKFSTAGRDDSISTELIRSVSNLYKRHHAVIVGGNECHLSKDIIFYYCSVVFFGDSDANALRDSFRLRRLKVIFECMQMVLLNKYGVKFETKGLAEELWKEIKSPRKMTLTLKLQEQVQRRILLGTFDGNYERTIELIYKKINKKSDISAIYSENVTDLPFGDTSRSR